MDRPYLPWSAEGKGVGVSMACLQLERIGLMVGRGNKELQCYKKIMKGYVHTSKNKTSECVCV